MDAAALVTPYNHISFKRRKNTWYTIASGNWSDPNIWMSNSHRRYAYPQAGDDVFVNHTVVTSVTFNPIVGNLYVSGSLSIPNSNNGVTVMGDLQVTGSLSMTGASSTLFLYGVNNFVSSFTATAGTVIYARDMRTTAPDQLIMDLPYFNLTVQGGGTKALTSNLVVNGNTTNAFVAGGVDTTLELGSFSPTFNGTLNNATGILSKTGAGSILCKGLFTNGSNSIVTFSGNPTVECRAGITFGANPLFTTSNLGTGTWSFTTASQTATINGNYAWNGNVSVVGAIDLTVAGTGIMQLNQPIDHTVSGRTTTNKGTIYFNSTSSLPSFTTGTFDRTSFANTVGYTMGASITLPYTSYSSLLVSNSGTKTSLGNTTLSGNLLVSNTIAGNAVYELSTFDLSVTGTTTVSPTCKLSKNGAGNILFVGNLGWVNSASATQIDFSVGNPSVELRGGMTQTNGSNDVVKTGTGTWKFTTNNQSITSAGGAGYIIFNGSILVSGAINLTVTRGTTDFVTYVNTVNGDNAASTFTIGANGQVYLLTATLPMATGVFSYNSVSTATLGFAFSGNYTIPYTSFGGLAIGNPLSTITGTKTLSGSTTLSGNLIIYGGPILELATFDFSVSGTTTNNYQISKTGSGNVLFIGLVTANATSLASPETAFNFTGNPAIEMRGGMSLLSTTGITGSGTLSFTTNNQSITAGGSPAINYAILISGAITVTNVLAAGQQFVFKNTINGNNAASTFDNRGIVNYQATQQPMLTGILQTNLAANTFIYNAAGNQNVTGGTYRILTLAGSGVKTLQGNTVVVTTYTLTPPATLNLNGFTRS